MHSNARARRTVATKETEEECAAGICTCDIGVVVTRGSSTPMPPFNGVQSAAFQLHEPKWSSSMQSMMQRVKVVFSETVNPSANNVSKVSLPSYRHLPWWACKRVISASAIAQRSESAHGQQRNDHLVTLTWALTSWPDLSTSLQSTSSLPIRNKLTRLCQWADREEHNLKPTEEPTVKNERNMIFLN